MKRKIYSLFILCFVQFNIFSLIAQDDMFTETDSGTVWIGQYLVNVDAAYQSTGDHIITFDGDDSDWKDYPSYELKIADVSEDKEVPDYNDFHVTYRAAWDDTYFYMLFTVVDDVISTKHPEDKTWHKDGVEITTFMVSDEVRRISDGSWGLGLWGTSPNWGQKVVITYDMNSASDAIDEGFNHYDQEENELRPLFDFDFIQSESDEGYIIEVMMSWQFLNGFEPSEEMDLGMYEAEPFVPEKGNMFTVWLAANDNDTPEGGNKEHTLLHQPFEVKWHTPQGNNSFIILEEEVGTVDAVAKGMLRNIQLFPNPVQDYLHINNIHRMESIRIMDITGKIVYSSVVKHEVNQKIDVSHLQNGVYLLNITQSNGESLVLSFVK